MKKPRIILFFAAICLFFTFQGSLFGEKWKLDDLPSLFNALKRPAGAAPAGTFDFLPGGAIMGLWWEVTLPRVVSANDENGNGLSDTLDFIEGGRLEAERARSIKSAYYRGGYPPDEEGVCTDVIWRAFKQAGYDLKK